jgi:hypothetical protein
VTVREAYRLSADSKTLDVEITAGDAKSTVKYVRIQDVGPCEQWPTPCKRGV